MKIKFWFMLVLVPYCFSCERVEYYPDKPIVVQETKILAHKGGGAFDEGNTLAACMYGLEFADGIEVDIQKSADNTIWLSHSSLTAPCKEFDASCFASLTDKTIIGIDTCLDKFDYTQLESVFKFMSLNYPDKFISLDTKAWSPCGLSHINITYEMNALAKAIISLTKKYQLEHQVMVESEAGDFLYYIKKHGVGIETYLATLGDYELGISRALDAGFSGVSFHYKFIEPISEDQIDLLHRKGLKIQLWTVNDEVDLAEAKTLNPDFIQTDNF